MMNVTEKMKKRMTLEEVRKLCHTNGVVETDSGFEVSDIKAEIVYVLPKDFYRSIGGRPLNPKRMLTLQKSYTETLVLYRGEDFEPSYVKFICGKLISVDGRREFYPVDYASMEKTDINVVLIRAHWDMVGCTADNDWNQIIQEAFGKELLYSHCYRDDDYGSSGDWYWVVRVNWNAFSSVFRSGVCNLTSLYMQTVSRTMEMAKEWWEEFEKHKLDYRGKILEILKPLDGYDGWKIDDRSDEQTVVWHRVAPGRQSPQKLVYLHDAIGLNKCSKQFGKKSSDME